MIHATSIIDKNAKISKTAKIGPYTIIGPNVEIGDGAEIHSHVNITGNTQIGAGTKIFPFASIGTQPQDLKYKGEKNSLVPGLIVTYSLMIFFFPITRLFFSPLYFRS